MTRPLTLTERQLRAVWGQVECMDLLHARPGVPGGDDDLSHEEVRDLARRLREFFEPLPETTGIVVRTGR